MKPDHTWRKARRSQNGPNCIEIRSALDQVRDSKNVSGPVLRVDVLSLVREVQAGRFDR